jgi:hypothetical protein
VHFDSIYREKAAAGKIATAFSSISYGGDDLCIVGVLSGFKPSEKANIP